MLFIYCYDAYCGWSYGFSTVIKRLEQKYKNTIPIEVLSGGMILPDKETSIKAAAPYLKENYGIIENTTGVHFGSDYLWHIHNPDKSDWFPNSEKPAIALSIVKNYHSDKALSFASDLQYALFYEGRDLTDDEAYRHLLEQYGMHPEEFYQQLHSDKYKEEARYEFGLVKQLNILHFPTLLLQTATDKMFLIAKGYNDYETVDKKIRAILNNKIDVRMN